MKHGLAAVLIIAFFVSALIPDPAAGSSAGKGLRGSLGMGYDDNIFREAGNIDSGWFLPYSFRFRQTYRFSPSDRLRPKIHASGRKYSGTNSRGDDARFGLSVSYTRRLVGTDLKHVRVPSLDLDLSGEALARQTTYYSRSSGEEVAVPGDNGPVSLSDRYDADSYQGAAALKFHWPRGWRWAISASAKRKDYRNDFTDVPSIDPLDYDNHKWIFRLERRLDKLTRLEGSYTYSATDYDAWTARDFDGNKVPGTSQQFRYKTFSGRLSRSFPQVAAIGLELYSRKRTDPFLGYYNYDEWGIRVDLSASVGERLDASLRLRYSHRDYERARVGFNLLKALRNDYDRLLVVDVNYALKPGRTLFAHLVHDNIDEQNPLYTYDRTRSSLGLRLEF